MCVGINEIRYHEGADIEWDDSAFLYHIPLVPSPVGTSPTSETQSRISLRAVSKDGYGDYTSIGEALLDTSSNVYYIYPGNYTEQVNITRPNVYVYGQTLTPWTYCTFFITHYLVSVPMLTAGGNTVTISRNMPASIAGSNDLSGTVRVLEGATGTRRIHLVPSGYRLSALNQFTVYNLNIENTYGKPVQQAQAIALSAMGGQLGVYGSVLSGWQDTLYADKVLLDSCCWSRRRTNPETGHSVLH